MSAAATRKPRVKGETRRRTTLDRDIHRTTQLRDTPPHSDMRTLPPKYNVTHTHFAAGALTNANPPGSGRRPRYADRTRLGPDAATATTAGEPNQHTPARAHALRHHRASDDLPCHMLPLPHMPQPVSAAAHPRRRHLLRQRRRPNPFPCALTPRQWCWLGCWPEAHQSWPARPQCRPRQSAGLPRPSAGRT